VTDTTHSYERAGHCRLECKLCGKSLQHSYTGTCNNLHRHSAFGQVKVTPLSSVRRRPRRYLLLLMNWVNSSMGISTECPGRAWGPPKKKKNKKKKKTKKKQKKKKPPRLALGGEVWRFPRFLLIARYHQRRFGSAVNPNYRWYPSRAAYLTSNKRYLWTLRVVLNNKYSSLKVGVAGARSYPCLGYRYGTPYYTGAGGLTTNGRATSTLSPKCTD